MTITPQLVPTLQRIDFLRRIHLFYRLEESNFDSIADKIQEKTYNPGEVIIRQGEEGDRFYMIYGGSVNVERNSKNDVKSLGKLVAGDYFGEEALLTHHRRNATVTAVERVLLLTLNREDFNQLMKSVRQLKSNFSVAVNTHRLARKMKFKWLRENEGEVIYFLARKHPILLLRVLFLPLMMSILALLGILTGFNVASPFFIWVSTIALGLILGWATWNWVDWANDYYIVTNQRVVWLEKVVGIYDSRQEAPLSAIQRINVQTEYWGRQLDYGTLIVRTIVGSTLALKNVDHPAQAAALIEEHWKRSRQNVRKLEEGAMRQAIRERLQGNKPVQEPRAASLVQRPDEKKPSPYPKAGLFANFLRVRFEALTTITYRKHWIVLLIKTWLPSLILLALFTWLIYEIFHISLKKVPALLANAGVDALLIVWLVLFIIVFSWWYYQYLNWSNDIFQVTPDQILDINKTPLGEVFSDIASLDNILHLEYERKGLLQVIFNYGNVYITIGGGKDMTFEDVFNPSMVQDDIERRRLERITKKEQENIRNDRERMADWFAAYQRNNEDLQASENEENPPAEGK
jgi:CRP-like cAMP-binding protein